MGREEPITILGPMRRSFLLLTALVILASATAALGKPTAAIVPTEVGQDSSSQLVTTRLEAALIATDSFQMLESRHIRSILEEQGFQQSGACDTSDCAIRIGQLLSMERMVQARLQKTDGHWELSGKLLDVATGQILVGHLLEIHGSQEDALQGGCRELAAILSGQKRPASGRTTLESRRPLWPWLTAGGVLLAGGGVGIWYFTQHSTSTSPPSSYQVQLDWSTAP